MKSVSEFAMSRTIDFFYFRTALIPSIIDKVIGAVIMDIGRLGGGPGGHLGGGPGGRLGGGPGGRVYIIKGIFLGGGGLPPSPPHLVVMRGSAPQTPRQ